MNLMDTVTGGVSDSFVILKQGAVYVDSLIPQLSLNGTVSPVGLEPSEIQCEYSV
jgi:hypothetical protein